MTTTEARWKAQDTLRAALTPEWLADKQEVERLLDFGRVNEAWTLFNTLVDDLHVNINTQLPDKDSLLRAYLVVLLLPTP